MARLATSEKPFWRGELPSDAAIPSVKFRPRQVLVLMPMAGTEWTDIYRSIKAGCDLADLTAVRVDETAGSALLMRELDRMMGEAEFMVFDLTQERPNVYYELGYAHGIGNHARDILLVCAVSH